MTAHVYSPPLIAPGRFLETILEYKRREVAEAKARVSHDDLARRIADMPPPLDFASALRAGFPGVGLLNNIGTPEYSSTRKPALIAEIKRGSPSKGLLSPDFNPVALARHYYRAGASALSVLTDFTFFGGDLSYIAMAKEVTMNQIPALRKDFIIDPYQLYEARAAGADAALLIVACFGDDDPTLGHLMQMAADLGLAVLVEVHNADEMRQALDLGAGIIGINNRDLTTFKIDMAITGELAALVPKDRDVILVGESGLATAADIRQLQVWGVGAALIGETLVKNGLGAITNTVAGLFGGDPSF